MTTERLGLRALRAWPMLAALPPLCGAAALLVLSCAHGSQARHGDRLDVTGYPPEMQRNYAVFARRCSRCHTLARPLNAHIRDPQHWVRYVTRMRRNPSSGINRADAALILDFLLFYTAQTVKAEQESEQPKDGKQAKDAAQPKNAAQPENAEQPENAAQPENVAQPKNAVEPESAEPPQAELPDAGDAGAALPPAPASEDAVP
jgi:hypothetical protein